MMFWSIDTTIGEYKFFYHLVKKRGSCVMTNRALRFYAVSKMLWPVYQSLTPWDTLLGTTLEVMTIRNVFREY